MLMIKIVTKCSGHISKHWTHNLWNIMDIKKKKHNNKETKTLFSNNANAKEFSGTYKQV